MTLKLHLHPPASCCRLIAFYEKDVSFEAVIDNEAGVLPIQDLARLTGYSGQQGG